MGFLDRLEFELYSQFFKLFWIRVVSKTRGVLLNVLVVVKTIQMSFEIYSTFNKKHEPGLNHLSY